MPAELATLVEIACDESGSEGEKLVGGNTEVFAHASVAIHPDAARDCVAELRRRIRSPAVEYKANHLLRAKNRSALVWILGPSGPIYGNAQVYLVEKTFFLVQSLAEQVRSPAGRPSSRDVLVLYRDAPGLVGPADWHAFLESSNQLLWTRNGDHPRPTPTTYKSLLNRMRRSAAGQAAGRVLEDIWSARAAVIEAGRPTATKLPSLDPMRPALARAIEAWADGGRRVSVIHDEQSTITPGLIRELKEAWPALIDVRLVDSMADARVQVADFLAGVTRRIAEDALADNGDAELTALLRPYVDPQSIWGDRTSWAAVSGS